MTEIATVGRRPILQGMMALGASSLIAARASGAERPLEKLDPANKGDQALIFRKLAFSLDDKIGFWWLRGTRYGLVDAEMTPFWEMHVGSFFTAHDLPGGEYEVSTMSVSFYTDLKTGAFIKTFANPFTGKTVDIGYFPPKPARVRFDADGRVDSAAGMPAGMVGVGTIGPAWIEGDQVWVRGDHLLRKAATQGSGAIRVNDLTTYFGSLREVADPAVKMPPAGQIFSDINTWPAWLQMGGHPGNYYSRAFGQKVFAYENMPAMWRALMAQEYPDIAKDPVGALRG